MSSEYNFNAPQFYSNLSEAVIVSDEEIDYFVDAKDTNVNSVVQSLTSPNDKENKENVVVISDNEDETSLNDSFSKIKIKSKFEGIDLSVENDRKSHPMLTRQDISILSPKLSLELRNRSVLKEVGVSHGCKFTGKKRKADFPPLGRSVAKYQSLAEAIYHFQRDTPPRFRGISKKVSTTRFSTEPQPHHSAITVPETPHFLSEQRLRHCTHNCLSQEERELQEIEEAKQQFKPQQLNKKIFEPPKEVEREKQFTIPKPFNFCEPPLKKVEQPKEEVFVFKANPLPAKIYGSCDNLRVSSHRLPTLMEESEEGDESRLTLVNGYKEVTTTKQTVVKPFSFDERDKLKAKRKLELIKKIIDEEKKVATFKAQPLPSYLADSLNSSLQSSCPSTSSQQRHDVKELNREFKARPALVLNKKPFQVKKCDKGPTKILDLKLNTELRAQQRLEFDQQVKTNQKLKEDMEAEFLKNKEEEEIAQLRKETVHKPLPLPKIYSSENQSSNESVNDS